MHRATVVPVLERVVAALIPIAVVLAPFAPTAASADDCPTSTFLMNGYAPEEFAGPRASGNRVRNDGGGGGYFFFDGFGDTASVGWQYGGTASLTARGRYRFLGPPAGTSVSNLLRLHVTGYVRGDWCNATYAQAGLYEDAVPTVGGQWSSAPEPWPGDRCQTIIDSRYTHLSTHPAGTPFELASALSLTTPVGFEFGAVHLKLEFGDMAPGTFLVRCDGDTTGLVLGAESGIAAGLRIASIRPNPSRGEFRASLAVPEGGPAFVRLLDITGRVVESRVWDASRAASRELTFGSELQPGHYFLQVSQGARSAVRAVTIRR